MSSAYGKPYGFQYGSGPPLPVTGGTPIPSGIPYEGDALFFHTWDGGDVQFQAGEPVRTGGLYAAVYLSLFGGNELDSGAANDRNEWWGNATETDPAYIYRSRTQYLLRTRPLVSANIPVIESAVKDDLAWMLTIGVADTVDAAAVITGPKRVQITVTITAAGTAEDFTFVTNWSAGV